MVFEWHDAIGTVGVLLILAAYLLLSLERLESNSLLYSILNAAGAALILLSLVQAFNFSAFLIETCWLLISLYSIYRNGTHRATTRSQ